MAATDYSWLYIFVSNSNGTSHKENYLDFFTNLANVYIFREFN